MDRDNELMTLAQTVHPAYALLTSNIHWRDVQKTADSSIVLTNHVSKAGFFVGHKFLMSEKTCSAYPEIMKQPDADVKVITVDLFAASSVSDALAKVLSLAWKSDAPVVIKCIDSTTLDIINSECVAKFNGVPWDNAQLAAVLSYNIKAISGTPAYPAPAVVSLEAFYATVLAQFHEKAIEAWPLLGKILLSVPLCCLREASTHVSSDAPSERKVQRLIKAMQRPRGWSELVKLPEDPAEASTEDLITLLEEASKSGCGKNRQRKMQRAARYLREMQETKDVVWRVQKTVRSLGTQTAGDYRQHSDQVQLLEGMLQCAMQRIKTDISISNMGTYRNPAKHPLHGALSTLCGGPKLLPKATTVANQCSVLLADLREAAEAIVELKQIGQFTSDWQNIVARHWVSLRARHTALQQEVLRYHDQLPPACVASFPPQVPPVQYYLALDLYPQASAFSFTYGRSQGYALPECYEDCVSWFLYSCNDVEKQFFRAILAKPEDYGGITWLQTLTQIPESIRKLAIKPDQFAKLVEELDKWFETPEGQQSTAAVHCRKLIKAKEALLGSWLRTKYSAVKDVSVIALFMAIMCDLPENCVLSGHYVDTKHIE